VPSRPVGAASVGDPKQLRAACRLALEVVRAGDDAVPCVPAPPTLVPILRFTRLSGGAFAAIARAVDDDPELRARVAAEAQESEVGPTGWLWLHRPTGWLADPAWTDRPVRSGPARVRAHRRKKPDAAPPRQVTGESETDRRRTAKQLQEAKRATEEAREEVAVLRARLAAMAEERNRAVREAKRLQVDLAQARRDLKVARQATREAEAELLARPVEGPDGQQSRSPPRFGSDDAADFPPPELVDLCRPGSGPRRGGGGGRAGGAGRRRTARAVAALPPGVFHATPAGHRHLLMGGGALLVVDGYNLARAAWSGLSPQEERRRTVALLEEVRARSGGEVVVVFDGDSKTVAPTHSRSVRVQFSETGVTADDHITALLAAVPVERPVVVVSSDRAVGVDARRHGATVLTSHELLVAAGR